MAVLVRHDTEGLPFGRTDAGRADLRGIDFGLISKHLPQLVRHFTADELSDLKAGKLLPKTPVERLDFSFPIVGKFSHLGGWTYWFHFRDIVFDGLSAEDEALAGTFDDCSFRGVRVDRISEILRCDLSFVKTGYIRRAEHCTFDYANLSGLNATNLQYFDCSFQNANLNRAEIGGAKFTRCNFQGASFDNVFYARTVFEQCMGLDVDRMDKFSLVMFGRKLSELKDIVIR